jgi:hypothetical protein
MFVGCWAFVSLPQRGSMFVGYWGIGLPAPAGQYVCRMLGICLPAPAGQYVCSESHRTLPGLQRLCRRRRSQGRDWLRTRSIVARHTRDEKSVKGIQ